MCIILTICLPLNEFSLFDVEFLICTSGRYCDFLLFVHLGFKQVHVYIPSVNSVLLVKLREYENYVHLAHLSQAQGHGGLLGCVSSSDGSASCGEQDGRSTMIQDILSAKLYSLQVHLQNSFILPYLCARLSLVLYSYPCHTIS